MAAQEASGVMAAAMLCQQGQERSISWESEVECVMREMARRLEGEDRTCSSPTKNL